MLNVKALIERKVTICTQTSLRSINHLNIFCRVPPLDTMTPPLLAQMHLPRILLSIPTTNLADTFSVALPVRAVIMVKTLSICSAVATVPLPSDWLVCDPVRLFVISAPCIVKAIIETVLIRVGLLPGRCQHNAPVSRLFIVDTVISLFTRFALARMSGLDKGDNRLQLTTSRTPLFHEEEGELMIFAHGQPP